MQPSLLAITCLAVAAFALLAWQSRAFKKVKAQNCLLKLENKRLSGEVASYRNQEWLLIAERDQARFENVALESDAQESAEQFKALVDLCREHDDEKVRWENRALRAELELASYRAVAITHVYRIPLN